MTDRHVPGHNSIDVMVASLERDRRVGWAKAYAAEEKLAEVALTLSEANKTIEQLRETEKLHSFAEGVLRVIAPSLSPWLAGERPGLQSFDGIQVSQSDERTYNRRAGVREAGIYLSLDEKSRQQRDWRARQLCDWYDDLDAKVPYCHCGCASWNHKGPGGPCIGCDCVNLTELR